MPINPPFKLRNILPIPLKPTAFYPLSVTTILDFIVIVTLSF